MSDIQNDLAVRRAAVPIVGGMLMPTDFDGIQRLAKFLHATGMVPMNDRVPCTETQSMLLVAKAVELGIPLTNIPSGMMIVRNKPCVWGDTMLALVQRSQGFVSIAERMEGEEAVCVVTRMRKLMDGTYATSGTEVRFSIAEAKTAGLWGKAGPWTQYPKRMLKMRARAFALRDMFADVLNGMGMVEEVRDYPQDAAVVEAERAAEITTTIAGLALPKSEPVAETVETEQTPLVEANVFAQIGAEIARAK